MQQRNCSVILPMNLIILSQYIFKIIEIKFGKVETSVEGRQRAYVEDEVKPGHEDEVLQFQFPTPWRKQKKGEKKKGKTEEKKVLRRQVPRRVTSIGGNFLGKVPRGKDEYFNQRPLQRLSQFACGY